MFIYDINVEFHTIYIILNYNNLLYIPLLLAPSIVEIWHSILYYTIV